MSARILLLSLTLAVFASSLFAGPDEAWQALSELRTGEAQRLFIEARLDKPRDISLMRGLYLAAAYELDREMQAAVVDTILHYAPGSPDLLCIFEHATQDLDGWTAQIPVMRRIAESLAAHASGATAYIGHIMQSSVCQYIMETPPAEWANDVNFAPGFWVCGPFDNNSGIALHRQLAVETAPFDTLADIAAMQGIKSRWSWVEADSKGDAELNLAVENGPDYATVLTVFFYLPDAMEVVILPGGAYSGRLLIDGHKVLESTRYRNAVQREGCTLSLSAGVHRLTAVICQDPYLTSFSTKILSPAYRPIDGFQWRRFGAAAPAAPDRVRPIHPIFDPWEEYAANSPAAPDIRYWRALLMIYNGHMAEAVDYLESIGAESRLSALETAILYDALVRNEEPSRAADLLNQLAPSVQCPSIEVAQIQNVSASYQETLKGFADLAKRYPGRAEIDMIASMDPLLKADMPGFIHNMDSIIQTYPEAAFIHGTLAEFLGDALGDHEAALEHKRMEYEKTGDVIDYKVNQPAILAAAGRLDEACEAAAGIFELLPSDHSLSRAATIYSKAGRGKELLPVIDEYIERYPLNIELYNLRHQILYESGQHEEARELLRQVHAIKPTAVMPYVHLPELHHEVSYDSLFGTVDVMDLWSREPDSADLRFSNAWTLLSKQQAVVMEHGLTHWDMHFAIVVMDEDAVQSYQSLDLPIDVTVWHNRLITARRLRRDSAPLNAEQDGNNLVFKDLQPGDVVEVRYRFWSSQQGDLWRHWWTDHQIDAGYYQHHLEYLIMTDRDDIIWAVNDLAPPPVEDKFCGYRRLAWSADRVKAVNTDLWYQPPDPEMMGWLYLSTLESWDSLRAWYFAVTEALLKDNPRAEALADSLTADCANDEMTRLKALYSHVLMRFPYQVLGFDYDASIPRDPDQVLINGWGDCKDKSILLIALLRRAGLDAWPVLMSTWDNGSAAPVPQFSFDHLITACRIGTDTLYVDVTGHANSLDAGVPSSLGGQPCLHVTAREAATISRLPATRGADYLRDDTMIVNVTPGQPSPFTYFRNYGGLSAGSRREDQKEKFASELISDFEGSLADAFDLVTKLDSVVVDTALSIEPWHRERLYGTFELSIQKAGKLTILKPPIYSPVTKQRLSHLYDESGERTYPVDLKYLTGLYRRTVVLQIPDEMGDPQMAEPVHIEDSLWRYSFSTEWNDTSRRLVLHFEYCVEDDQCEADEYEAFAREVIAVYEAPIIFDGSAEQ